MSYYVSPAGEVYAIVTQHDQSELIRLSSTGEVLSRVRVMLPRYFLLQSFAVLIDGSAMLVGITPLSEASARPSYQAQAFWIDPNGAVISPAKNGKDVPSSQSDHGYVTTDSADKFVEYIDGSLTIYTKQGNVAAKYALDLPDETYFVDGIQYLNGKVALLVSQIVDVNNQPQLSVSGNRYGAVTQSWLVVDESNGLIDGLYSAPANFTGAANCYLGSNRFLYSHVEKGHLRLVEMGP